MVLSLTFCWANVAVQQIKINSVINRRSLLFIGMLITLGTATFAAELRFLRLTRRRLNIAAQTSSLRRYMVTLIQWYGKMYKS